MHIDVGTYCFSIQQHGPPPLCIVCLVHPKRKSIFSSRSIFAMADEPVDPLPKLTEACKPKCVDSFKLYEACAKRIAVSKEGDCEPWYFDHLKCLDACRVPQLKNHWK